MSWLVFATWILIRSCFDEASEPEVLHTFSYISDLLLSFVPPHDPNETLYRMVRACIDSRCRSPQEIAAIRLYFEVWLLRLGGYLPDWTHCDACKKPLSADEPSDVKADFHLLCGSCRKTRSSRLPQSSAIFSGRHKNSLLKNSWSLLRTRQTPSTMSPRILRRIISNLIGREVAGEKAFAVNF